jgi:hypothetical protein
MVRRIGFMAALLSTLLSPPAVACETFRDEGRLLSFGAYELGSHPSAFPADIRKSDNCYELVDENYYDCLYIDRDGVEYLVYGSEIVRKEIPDLRAYRERVVGGIQAGDTLGAVLRKFGRLREELRYWNAGAARAKDSDKLYVGSSACLQLPSGTPFYFHLEFDGQDQLVGVTASIHSGI